jgi:short-subunit dehydrogenase
MNRVHGKVCVVTGASSGIGEATVKALARAGARVVLAARREDRLAALGQAIRSDGGQATWVPCDVTRVDDVEGLRAHVDREHGRCDVLVNNAGVPGGGRFADLTLEQIETVTATNYLGVLYCTKVLLPDLLESRGHAVNVASLAGRYALPGAAVYTAAKHAVVALSESLYYELRERGVMVTSINPGLVETEGFPMTELKRDPVARNFIMRPERVARVIVDVIRRRRGPEVSVPRWLASPQAFRVLAPPLYRAALARLVGGRARTQAAPRA